MNLNPVMEKNKFVSVIIAAAGSSTRFSKSKTKFKQFISICGKPLLLYSIEKFCLIKDVKEIITVTNDINATNKILRLRKFSKKIKLVLGGKLRQDSVYKGFCSVDPKANLVLIHDVSRPLFTVKDTKRCIEAASKTGVAILAVPAIDTLKRGKFHKDKLVVKSTINRNEVYLTQTPQVISSRLLAKAYRIYKSPKNVNKVFSKFTDEASMIELLQKSVNLVIGSRTNIKITYPEDLKIASGILKELENV